MSSFSVFCAQCAHSVLSSLKENFSLLLSALDETTPTIATLLRTNSYPSARNSAHLMGHGRKRPARNRHYHAASRQLLDIQETHRRAMSPVRHLPAEILSKIFTLATGTSFYDAFDPQYEHDLIQSGLQRILTRCCAQYSHVLDRETVLCISYKKVSGT
ncbi:hypothetical protein F5146DRAFT_1139827 [Armillaria mellea]|nr:hypothetical protein F5146DRAFT_1139827 [Armillaria mellea]